MWLKTDRYGLSQFKKIKISNVPEGFTYEKLYYLEICAGTLVKKRVIYVGSVALLSHNTLK